jgi:hypothetical protein
VRSWLAAGFAVGCTGPEYGVQRQDRVDVFEQDRLAAIDLLLVVDNSCSMVEEQAHLSAAFDTLLDGLQAGNTEWRVAVTTPETSFPAWRASLEGALDSVALSGADGAVLDRVEWDDREWAIEPGATFAPCGAGFEPRAPTRGAPDPCAGAPLAGPDDGPRPPAPGELWLSEVAPLADEPGCGWLELWNRGPATLDLAGVTLWDDAGEVVFGDGWVVAPGDTLVWTALEGCGDADVVDDGLHLASGERWVERDTPDADRVFADLVTVGTGGFGLEMGLENALLALASPATPETDAGFRRKDADLAVVFVSDEDDLSPDPVATYVNAFRALAGVSGQRDPERVRLAVVAGVDPPEGGGPSCASDLGEAGWAPRYVALAALSGGDAWSICDDLGAIATEVGLTVSTQRHEFQLSGVPALDTLELAVYASASTEEPLPTPVRGVDYDLFARDDAGRQEVWLRFVDGALPPGSVLVVTYEVLPDDARVDLTSEGT